MFDGKWGYQAFDESDDDAAVMMGEAYAEQYDFDSEAAVIEFVEDVMA